VRARSLNFRKNTLRRLSQKNDAMACSEYPTLNLKEAMALKLRV